jgi:hypothetical protein
MKGKKKQYSFKADKELIEGVWNKIDKENKKLKWDERKNLSSKINELLYDYISR